MRTTFSACRAILLFAVLVATPQTAAAASPHGPVDVTATAKGKEVVQATHARLAKLRVPTNAAEVRVWALEPGEYLVGSTLPLNYSSSVVKQANGMTRIQFQYDVASSMAHAPAGRASTLSTINASWVWLGQACFSRVSNTWGYIDSCYVMHGLRPESDPRDFFQLEQYGTVGANLLGKIYSGSLQAVKASSSSAMSWIDWSPRGSINGNCAVQPLKVSALSVSISSQGIMCENWNITKYADAGHFKEEWSCGCIWPFGQPYPNTREIDYMQAISTANGGRAVWTLSSTFLAL